MRNRKLNKIGLQPEKLSYTETKKRRCMAVDLVSAAEIAAYSVDIGSLLSATGWGDHFALMLFCFYYEPPTERRLGAAE